MPVHVWHGEQDVIVPIGQGQIMAQALPHACSKFYPSEGHVSLVVNHYEELLGTMIG